MVSDKGDGSSGEPKPSPVISVDKATKPPPTNSVDKATKPPPKPAKEHVLPPTDADAFANESPVDVDAGTRIYLVARLGDHTRVLDLTEQADITIGREQDAAIVVDDSRVSRLHARIWRRGNEVGVDDLGSRNGTKVNGAVLRSRGRPLVSGDVLQVGPLEVVVAATASGATGSVEHGARLERELERVAARGNGKATLLRVALDPATANVALTTMTQVLADMDLVESRGDGEYAVLTTGSDEARTNELITHLGRQAPGAEISAVRYPDDGSSIQVLWDKVKAKTGASAAEQVARPQVVPPGGTKFEPKGVVVADQNMVQLYRVARRVANTPTTVLVFGETGVGKEVVAEALHRWSSRAKGPFVRLNCASLPEALLESELFGYEKGAFTGADRRKVGYLEAADGGTLLLDEIGELSAPMQAKLLRAVENRSAPRVGGTQEIAIDVRFVCATHRNLKAEVEAGRFRRDLFYRVSAFTLKVPPLRERPTEVTLLADLFAREFARHMGAPAPRFEADATTALERHSWPGNIRELRNAVEYAMIMSDGSPIRAAHLPEPVLESQKNQVPSESTGPVRSELAEVERRRIEQALDLEGGNQTRAAQKLGMSRRNLVYKIAKYGIKR